MRTTKTTIAKGELHELIERLPEKELPAARSYLRYLATIGGDRVLDAILRAQIDDEPETEEERAAVREAREDVAAGRTVMHEEACRQLLGP